MVKTLDFVAPLFVPANRPERFEKAARAGADAVILDLEDAVPADGKAAARAALRTDFTQLPVLVRINACGTPHHEADIAALDALNVDAVVIPKAEPGDAFDAARRRLRNRPLVLLIETARGLAGVRALAALPSVARLAFGSVDFCVDLGCAHTRETLLLARCELVLASRLTGLPAPLDGVTVALDDPGQVESDAAHARDLGFGGKLLIHPRQVEAALRGFRPGPGEIAWARRIAAAADGASAIDGEMVDEPVRRRARSILARAGPISD